MKQKVQVTVTGTQFDIEDSTITTVSEGEYFLKGDKHYVLYQETDEDGHRVKNTLKISRERVEMLKKGSFNTHMVFDVGKKNVMPYQTPFGNLQMGVSTGQLHVLEREDIIQAEIFYALEMNDEHLSDCRIEITVKNIE